ncbi:BlaI/MecI/CopY family transcriptional regulator, partial [Mycolicibacterium sp. GF69]
MRVRGFGELEAVIMERVWDYGPDASMTVREIFEQLAAERQIAYTTVMSTMDNLHTKGWLARERDGRAYRYWATLSREQHTARLMRDALKGGGRS